MAAADPGGLSGMRVAVVCPYDLSRPGGGQSHTVELVRRLGQVGVEATLIAPGRRDSVDSVSVGRGLPLRANRSTLAIALDPRAWRRTRAEVRRRDLVHVHEPFMPLLGPASLRTGLPTVATFHADPPRWVGRTYRLLSRPAGDLLRGARITAVSPVAAAPLPPEWGQPEIVPIAIDVASHRAGAVERVPGRVVFLGRDDPRKGLDVLLAAWGRVRAEHPGAELVVAGAERRTGQAGVETLGRVDDAEKVRLLGSASVLVAPNTGAESFGTVLAEGMAAGCAVVASDLPAFRWVVGEAGRLVPPGDADALADVLVALLGDGEERDRLSRAAAGRVGRFDWPVVLAGYLDVYRRAGTPP